MFEEISGNKLYMGDCLEGMKLLPDNSVDSIVTDPPYGLSFMGKKWDVSVPSVEIWEECLRVLKPGGFLLAFAGTRTQHRMACNIEDAGFEIRDMIAWVYGSGFPKSLNVSKAIDKAAGAEREVVGTMMGKGGENLNSLSRELGNDSDTAKGCGAFGAGAKQINVEIPVIAPATDEAKQWDGWGTALKPALEPITVARKPLSEKNVAANVLKYGTGAINVDECRIPLNGDYKSKPNGRPSLTGIGDNSTANLPDIIGRWPANLIHDGSDEVLAGFPQSKGQQGGVGPQHGAKNSVNCFGDFGPREQFEPRGDSGSAARFFYCAKASRSDRNEGIWQSDEPVVSHGASMRTQEDTDFSKRNGNFHPTVKPTELMKYLSRLVTQPGGTILSPFMGSGSGGKAAILEGFKFIGFEITPEYYDIAKTRIQHAADSVKVQSPLEDFM